MSPDGRLAVQASETSSMAHVVDTASGAIRALLDLTPKLARRVRSDGSDEEVALEEVAVGDMLRIRPGEKVPVDGIVVEGRGTVDESMVTGESMPVTKAAGAALIGGTINQTGGLLMRSEKVGPSGTTMMCGCSRSVAWPSGWGTNRCGSRSTTACTL